MSFQRFSSKTAVARVVWVILLALLLVGAGGLFYRWYHARDMRYCRKAEICLQQHDTREALRLFSKALALNPRLMRARLGIIKTLVEQREFPEAFEAIERAVQNDLSQSDATQLKARVFSARGADRVAKESSDLKPKTCEQAITEDLDPAIELLKKQMASAEEPASAWTLLGDLYQQKQQTYLREYQILIREYDLAHDHEKKEQIAAREMEIHRVASKRLAQEALAINAYTAAVKRDEEAERPRIGIAQFALEAYVPRTRQAKEILEPLMKRSTVPPEALSLMATVELYDKDYDRALEHIRKLTQVESPRLVYLLKEAEILIEAERWQEAEEVGRKMVVLNEKNPAVRYSMGRILMHLNRANEAVDHLQNIFSSPNRRWPQARLLLAQALMNTDPPRPEQAVRAYRAVLSDSWRYLYGTATARIEKEVREAQYKACVALAGASKEVGQKNAAQYAVMAFNLAPARLEAFELVRDAQKAVGADAAKIENFVLLRAAALAANPGQMDAADEFLQKQYAEFKDTPGKGVRIQLARAAIMKDRASYREAIAIYEGLRKEFPKAPGYAYQSAAVHEQIKEDPEARKIYESLLADNPHDLRAVAGLVRVLVRSKDMAEAHAVLERAAGSSDSDSAKVMAAMLILYLHEKRVDDAVALAKSYVEKHPASPEGQCFLAALLWRQGDLKGAKSAYDAALKLAPDFGPALKRAPLDIEDNRAADAVTLLRAAMEKEKTDSSKTNLAVALQADGKTQEAGEILKAISASGKEPMGPLDLPRWYLAVLRAGEGDLAGAMEMNGLLAAKDFISSPEERVRLLKRVAAAEGPARRELAAKLNVVVWLSMIPDCPGMVEQAESLGRLLPDEPIVSYWQARLLAADRKYEEAVKPCREALRARPGFLEAGLLLAQSYHRSGKPEEAIQTLEDLLNATTPEVAAKIQLNLAELYENQDKLDKAISNYRSASAAVQPALAAQACNQLAWLYVTKRNDPDSALPFAEQAAQLAPNNPGIIDTLGWVLYVKGENERALACLTQAKLAVPNNPTIRYHMGMALLKAGEKDKARKEFEAALDISKDFAESADAAAQLSGL